STAARWSPPARRSSAPCAGRRPSARSTGSTWRCPSSTGRSASGGRSTPAPRCARSTPTLFAPPSRRMLRAMSGQERQPTEEELRAAYEAELKKVRVEDVVVQTVLSLISLGGRKAGLAPGSEDERDPEQLRQAVEAVRTLLPLVEPALGPGLLAGVRPGDCSSEGAPLSSFLTVHGVVLALVCAGVAVLYGATTARALLALSPGNAEMQRISGAVQIGARAYLSRQY